MSHIEYNNFITTNEHMYYIKTVYLNLFLKIQQGKGESLEKYFNNINYYL